MIYGFTGTRQGMNDNQKRRLMQFIEPNKPYLVVHGDCIGADTDFHNYCFAIGIPIEIRPCDHPTRAWNEGARLIHPVKKPLSRNEDIVKQSHLMLGTPGLNYETTRGGTWHAIRFAKKKQKPLIIFWPDGRVEKFHMPENNLYT